MKTGVIAVAIVAAAALASNAHAAPVSESSHAAYGAPTAASACSAAVRRRRATALKRYQRSMARERRAYFRRHRSARARRAFVRRQQAKLRRLRAAVRACARRPVPTPAPTPRADLAVAFTGTPPPQTSARRLTYRVTATNHGPARIGDASILLARVGAATVASTSGGSSSCSGDPVVSCTIGSLERGESKTVEVVLRPHAYGAVTVEAEAISYGPDDPSQANNRAAATTEFRIPPPSCPPSLWAGVNPVMLTEGDWGEDGYAASSRDTAAIAMVFVDFPDAPATQSTTGAYDTLVPEAARFFSATSHGRFGIEVTPHHRWVRMPAASGSYSQTAFLREAVAAVDPEVDFRPFEMVAVVMPRTSQIGTFAYIVQPGAGVSADGVELRHGTAIRVSEPGTVTPHGYAHIFVHELAHTLGLPDLYNADTRGSFVGSWDPMDGTLPMGEFLAWHKWKLGWLDAAQVGCLSGPGTVEETLTPLGTAGGVKAVVALTGPSTAIVAEARRKVGEDADQCEEGVLVYTVDATVRSGHGPVRVRPAQPDGSTLPPCQPFSEAPYDAAPGEVATFDDPAAGVTVEVLASLPEGYRVRVTKR
jgi:M6 family metalloprotease-like protein